MNSSSDNSLYILDLRTNRVSTVPGSDGLYSPVWSPDGQYIAATTDDSLKLMLFDFKTQKWVALVDFTIPKGMDHPIVGWESWSHDGKRIYFDSYFGTDQGIFRAGIGDHKLEKVVSLKDVRQTGTFYRLFPNIGSKIITEQCSPEDSPRL